MGFFGSVIAWILSWFYSQELEIAIVGLQNSGKTTLLNVFADTIPTIGFNMRKVRRGKTQLKCWDIGGQPRFRSMWERYCRSCNLIIFVLDAADKAASPAAKEELHALVSRPQLSTIPLLVLANKNDLNDAISVDQTVTALSLNDIQGRDLGIYSISAKNCNGLDAALNWVVVHGKAT